MKKSLSLILAILMCLCALTVLTSCDVVLDLIFGSKTPSNPPNSDEPPAHTHKMVEQTYVGETCSAQTEITYYECGDCGKYYLDKQGNDEIADISALGGHVFVIKRGDTEHYFECSLCQTEQDDSRGLHASSRWWYNPSEHYKQCDVCGVKFANGSHDETGSCSVCGRKADYEEICNSRYGYDQLAVFERGDSMQKLYGKIDKSVSAAHDNANLTASSLEIDIGLDVGMLNIGDVKNTIASYSHDNPLYYWIDWQFRGCDFKYPFDEEGRPDNERRCTGVILYIAEEYRDGAQRTAQNSVIYAEIDKYLSSVSNENDPYYIALGLHDSIIANVDYATKSDGTAEEALWAHSVVGVFDNKSNLTNVNAAVCEGYAKAYQLLLNACGVDNVYVTGRSHDQGHAWNLVKLKNDNWYWVDVTWDDQPGQVNGVIYKYFCQPDNVFAADHTVTVSNPNDGVNYLYALPAAATEEYKTSFTQQNFTYQILSSDSVSLTKCLYISDDGIAAIPSAVEYDGRTYAVTQIDKEAFATYTYAQDNKTLLSVSSPSITKIVIPDTVEVIYSKSFKDCSTLQYVEFADCTNWQRYGLTGETPIYEKLSSADLSNPVKACKKLQEMYKASLLSPTYSYVWVKN